MTAERPDVVRRPGWNDLRAAAAEFSRHAGSARAPRRRSGEGPEPAPVERPQAGSWAGRLVDRLVRVASRETTSVAQDLWGHVKLVDTAALAGWETLPSYEEHESVTYADYWAAGFAALAILHEHRVLMDDLCELERLDTDTTEGYDSLALDVGRSWRRRLTTIPLPPPSHPGTVDTPLSAGVRIAPGRLVLRAGLRRRTVRVSRAAPSRVVHADRLRELSERIGTQPAGAVDRLRAVAGAFKPVLFISHRWEHPTHPDPRGAQLARLRALDDCYLVYDFSSFPQQRQRDGTNEPLDAILRGMDRLLRNVAVLASSGYAERGWCFYEYLVANIIGEVAVDELSDERFLAVRRAAASRPPPGSASPHVAAREVLRGGGSPQNEVQNAIAAALTQSVQAVVPAFSTAQFTVPDDRGTVRALLVDALVQALPPKKVYQQYVGEWTSHPWMREEVGAMIDGTAPPHDLQVASFGFELFEPAVPSQLREAAERRYRFERVQTWAPHEWEAHVFSEVLSQVGPTLARLAVVVAAAAALLTVVVVAGAVWLLVWRPSGVVAWVGVGVTSLCLLIVLGTLAALRRPS